MSNGTGVLIRYKKSNGKLVAKTFSDKLSFDQLRDSMQEGEEAELYIEVIKGNSHTRGQINMVHKIIRTIAEDTGSSFNDVKKEVKQRAGFCADPEEEDSYKSFGDCSYEEISLAIHSAMELGMEYGLKL
jgi:hypothetical protein